MVERTVMQESVDMSHIVSGINSLLLSVNLIPVSLSLTCLFHAPVTYHILSLSWFTTPSV